MSDRVDFTTGPVAQRARRNPLIATTHAVETLVTVGAEPAVLSLMESVVRCLDDEGRAVLRRACGICMAKIDKRREGHNLDDRIALLDRTLRKGE